MKKLTFILGTVFLLTACGASNEPTETSLSNHQEEEETTAEEVPEKKHEQPKLLEHPANYTSMADAKGDLNGDGIDEQIYVYTTPDSTEFGAIREIVIYKEGEEKWEPWVTSRAAIMNSDEGGMMGDPFDGIEIKNGVLHISHWGGSSWKWSTIDKYRYQNDQFELIGFTSTYGKPCEYWREFDFNVSTGKAIGSQEPEKCEDHEPDGQTNAFKDEFKIDGIHQTLKNRERGAEIESPESGQLYYM